MDLNSSEDDEPDRGAVPLRASKRHCVQRPSASGNSSRYAGRNSVHFVGRRITVYWRGDAKWYSGTIREYSAAVESYLVLYDDGTQSSEDLDDCTWVWEYERPVSGAVDEVPTEAGSLKLYLSGQGSTGYLHVYPDQGRFRARITAIEGRENLGTFDTAVEAAVAVAKKLLEPTQSLVTEAQGLKLHLSNRSNNTTGYRGVSFEPEKSVFRASAGNARLPGSFRTAVEAAVAVAKHLQEKEEVIGADEEEEEEEDTELVTQAEGLKLHLSSKSRTGYLHVTCKGSRFRAKSTGKFHLGAFASAVEAAVAIARWYLQDHDDDDDDDDDDEEEEEEEDEEDDEDDEEEEEEAEEGMNVPSIV